MSERRAKDERNVTSNSEQKLRESLSGSHLLVEEVDGLHDGGRAGAHHDNHVPGADDW